MKITALKQQIKNPDRVSIYLDGKYSFSLTLNQVVAEKIKIGLELDEETLSALKQKSTDEKLRLKAMNWTLQRPHSIRELRDYLRRVIYAQSHKTQNRPTEDSKNASEQIIEEFSARGWVNDEVFAKWWVERSSRASRSTSHLKSELMQKGVDREIISDALMEREDEGLLSQLVEKLRLKTKYQDDQKLMRHLVSKGFSYSSVREALKLGAEDSPD